MTTSEYSKEALKHFLNAAALQGLVNGNTAAGWKAAFSKILENVADGEDVRNVDVKTAIRRYNNAHPGELSPASLLTYERRLNVMIAEFQSYVAEPAKYKGHGRHPTTGINRRKVEGRNPAESVHRSSAEVVPGTGSLATSGSRPPQSTGGLALEFPMRPDFLAQVVVPRDMRLDEARRFTAFILTLAADYSPGGGPG